MNFLENITFRRARARSEPNDDNDFISQTFNCTGTNSMPDMSDDEEECQITILKAEIEKLNSQLKNAHKEIETLKLENTNLKQCNEELIKEKCGTTTNTNSPKKHKRKTPTKNKTRSLKDTEKETRSEDVNLTASNTTQKISQSTHQNNPSPVLSTSPKHKVYMISSETSNRLLNIIERTELHNNEICHFRMPKCGLKVLLDCIDKKVKNFTYSDYCIIYIGEEDFRKTHNYIELVTLIRDKLMPLQHTNFIICLPTFKYMENTNIMFNSRVDIFNNLLYLDVETYNYAYVLDSNYNLPYIYETYNPSGNLNYKGLKIIISDLLDLVLYINSLKTEQIEVDCFQKDRMCCLSDIQTQTDTQFFL